MIQRSPEELVDLLTAAHSATRLFFKNEPLPAVELEFGTVLLPPERGILWRGWAPEDQNAPRCAQASALVCQLCSPVPPSHSTRAWLFAALGMEELPPSPPGL